MPLTADQQQLVNEVGDTTDGRLAAVVGTLQAVWASKDAIRPGLARLYTKLQLIETKQGAVADQVTYNQLGKIMQQDSDLMKHNELLYQATLAEIRRMEAKARGRRGGASLPLLATTPSSPPLPSPPFPDANDARWRGDPYRRPLLTRDEGIP